MEVSFVNAFNRFFCIDFRNVIKDTKTLDGKFFDNRINFLSYYKLVHWWKSIIIDTPRNII